jgi:hypothetical protein
MEEVFNDKHNMNVVPKIADIEIVYLTREDMELLGHHKESFVTTEKYIQLFDSGNICLAAKIGGEIAAYSWCGLKYLYYKGRTVVLKANEAFLFDARTYQAFRGKNIAPYVRHELNKIMKMKGVDRCYSITLLSNTASMKFKQKLGARPIAMFLYIGLFRKYHMHFQIKRMS